MDSILTMDTGTRVCKCGQCGWEWTLRETGGDGPERCPKVGCRSKRWRTKRAAACESGGGVVKIPIGSAGYAVTPEQGKPVTRVSEVDRGGTIRSEPVNDI
jgi:hypothetical protein